MATYQAGYNKGVTFNPAAAGAVSINIQSYDWAEEVDALDVTHTGTSGVQALLPGVLRGECNIEANYDSDQVPSGTSLSLTGGVKGVIVATLSSGKTITIPVMVVRVNYRSEVAGIVRYSFTARLDSIAGSLTRPT